MAAHGRHSSERAAEVLWGYSLAGGLVCSARPARSSHHNGAELMCLAIPGKLLDATQQNGIRYGRVNFGGVVREVCLVSCPKLQSGTTCWFTWDLQSLVQMRRRPSAPSCSCEKWDCWRESLALLRSHVNHTLVPDSRAGADEIH
jgi:hypothetical protein